MVLHLMPAPVQPELSNHLKFVYYILYIIWLMSCLPMTRDEWQSDWGVKKQDVSWQITSESLIDRLTCLTRWGMRMKMMTRRSQSIWRIDLIFITKKRTWNKKKQISWPRSVIVCMLVICLFKMAWFAFRKHPQQTLNVHLQESRRRRAALMAKPVTPVMTCDGTAPVTYHLFIMASRCQVQGWEGLNLSKAQLWSQKKGPRFLLHIITYYWLYIEILYYIWGLFFLVNL